MAKDHTACSKFESSLKLCSVIVLFAKNRPASTAVSKSFPSEGAEWSVGLFGAFWKSPEEKKQIENDQNSQKETRSQKDEVKFC